MTAKEKASELVALFEARIEQRCNQSSRDAHFEAAKQCASIAVEEAMRINKLWADKIQAMQPTVMKWEDVFWQQVKNEIENI
jgi:hypothetical protein